MSPFSKCVILDNDCVSKLYVANSLKQVLSLWPYKAFAIPDRVLDEAKDWPEHGKNVHQLLTELIDAGTVDKISLDEDSESELNVYIQLRLKEPFLGKGESEAIAMASNRDLIVATDDQEATAHCKMFLPSVEVVTTGDILKMAKSDGFLEESHINRMWRLIKERQSKQQIE